MAKIRLTVTESRCRSGYHKAGDTFIVEDLCPPLCHELWNCAYPYVFALQNGAALEHGETRDGTAVRTADGCALWARRRNHKKRPRVGSFFMA